MDEMRLLIYESCAGGRDGGASARIIISEENPVELVDLTKAG